MSLTRPGIGVRAFTLIELLCVIGIITLLAALLLPTLSQGQARARRIACVNHLHEAGVSFVSFANEHNGQFPMAVPGSAGGSRELAQGGYRLQGDFYFSFRHFQALSNELVTPKLLVCPADTRLPASNFGALGNSNLSYFIGINAEFARPASILAGDRNLTNDYAASGSLVRLGYNHALRWTDELHRFKGNLLFSDGHVEQKNNPALLATDGQLPVTADLALPTVRQPGTGGSRAGGSSAPWTPGIAAAAAGPQPGSCAPATDAKTPIGAFSVVRLDRSIASDGAPVMPSAGTSRQLPVTPHVGKRSTNAVATATPASPGAEDGTVPQLRLSVAPAKEGLTAKRMGWFYALLLLFAAGTIALLKLARDRKKRAANR